MTEAWVEWWCCSWRWAHPEWQAQLSTVAGLGAGNWGAIAHSRHADLLRSIAIDPSQPPAICEDLMRWLALSPLQKDTALSLAGRVCFSSRHSAPLSNESHDLWCQRFAKALRPGLWLDPGVEDERLLLGAWLGEVCWSRLRLTWAPGEVGEPLAHLPSSKLQTLWQAVLWRVTTPSSTGN
ncbi:type III secretion protein [Pseudomonas rossensis]|uniref:type III secretion protein n=1 Tax=Pseudomonas rossensis TaxID=2305471 RepID=UPI0032610587